MGVPFVKMGSDAIRKRLAELDQHEASFTARDLDAELGDVLRAGGNIDAIEAKQLEAERLARRLRVERIALAGELPNAIKREGAAKLANLVDEHRELKSSAKDKAEAIVTSWSALKAAVDEFAAVQEHAHQLTRDAISIVRETNAEMPRLGTFQHSGVVGVAVASREIFLSLGTAETEMQTVMGQTGFRTQ